MVQSEKNKRKILSGGGKESLATGGSGGTEGAGKVSRLINGVATHF